MAGEMLNYSFTRLSSFDVDGADGTKLDIKIMILPLIDELI